MVATLLLQNVQTTVSSQVWLRYKRSVAHTPVEQFALRTEGFDSYPGSNTSTARGLRQAAEELSVSVCNRSRATEAFSSRDLARVHAKQGAAAGTTNQKKYQ